MATIVGFPIQTVFAQHQINLGSFSLQRSPYTGDLQLGLGQNANIFGFGADRQLGFNLGPGRFGAKGLVIIGRVGPSNQTLVA